RWLNERVLGIDRRRVPPGFAREPFEFQAARALSRPRSSGRPKRSGWLKEALVLPLPDPGRRPNAPFLLLFPATFVNYHQPPLTWPRSAVSATHRCLASRSDCPRR